MLEFKYDELFCRNWPLITRDQQHKLKNTKLLIAGCGTIGSVIAEASVRMGFEILTIADGDTVAVKNLNRQAYDSRDVGENKTKALKKRLKRINPGCLVTAIPYFLDRDNIKTLVEDCDIVVDAIDFLDINAIVALHREARGQGKSIVTGINLGWCTIGMVFTPKSMTIEQMLTSFGNVKEDELLDANIEELISKTPNSVLQYIPSYFSKVLIDLAKGSKVRDIINQFPQTNVAALQCATFGIAALTRVALGLPTPIAPKPICFDTWVSLIPREEK